jgi:hypothetical protein
MTFLSFGSVAIRSYRCDFTTKGLLFIICVVSKSRSINFLPAPIFEGEFLLRLYDSTTFIHA